MIVYLHGFNSGGASAKATWLRLIADLSGPFGGRGARIPA
jgi:predicted esterase YcpF (UPF0227 family)